MKKILVIVVIALAGLLVPQRSHAPLIVGSIIKAIIMGIDLGIQKQQNKIILLQEAQKQLENIMQQTHLTDITGWVQKQKDLYGEYYNELWQVKNAISAFQKVKDLVRKQIALVSDYKKAYAMAGRDGHFSPDELSHIYKVYDGIYEQSVKNLDQVYLVINAFATQMDDADRLKIIDEADRRISNNYNDLKNFTQQNSLISLQRAKDQADADMVKALYGLQ